MKTDDEGHLLLTCIGTRRDLEVQGIQLKDGLVLNVTTMSGAAISEVVNGTGTNIGGFCNSGACLARYIR